MSCETQQVDPTLPGLSKFQCLFVGKGPSIIHARAHLDFGDLAVVNEAGTDLGRSAITFIDGSREPHNVSQDTGLIVSPQVAPKPVDAARVQAPIWKWPRCESLRERFAAAAISSREPTYLSAPGPSGVIFLFLRGYRKIWLFGHDGGIGCAEGYNFADTGTDYSLRRKVIESMIPALQAKGCQVKFWPERFE